MVFPLLRSALVHTTQIDERRSALHEKMEYVVRVFWLFA